MQRYATWKPTQYDSAGLALPDQQNWLVLPVVQTRESRCLHLSNFAAALRRLGGESATVEVHRFHHWGCGWFEIILVHPGLEDAAQEIEDALDHYPILDENDYDQRRVTRANDYWCALNLRDRVEWCTRYGVSPFAARRDTLPSDDDGLLFDALAE